MTVAVADLLAEPVERPPLLPPRLPTLAEVHEDPARAAVAASLAWLLAGQLGDEDTAADAREVLVAALSAA